ncbi:MAG TPA: UbiA family prenyltransferase [Pseudomonas sp.]|nr:UbiA family prenyltransferase [Pseudomonas sp.]
MTLTPPLVIDLDGTLLRSDLLLETGMAFVRSQPLQLFKPFSWLAKGKASLKEGLALATHLDVSVLPYDPEVIAFIEAERESGRRVVLATASHHSLAERIALHLNLFDQVLATEGKCNLSAHRKRDLLVEHYGEQGFDYAGNSQDDMPIWASARQAYVVNPESGVERRARAQGNVEQVLHSNPARLKDWLKALRLHQWMKNVLVFVPLLAAHQLTDPLLLWQGLLAFLLFGLCASSVYLLNDLLDLADDRHHHSKRNRPFAAGRLSIKSGLVAFPVLLGAAFAGAAFLLPWQFSAVLLAYYVMTLAYSLSLKRRMAVDVIVLAMLYTVRIIAGAAAFGLALTFWVLAFSMFMFLSLALVKRYAELLEAKRKGNSEKIRGRGYYPEDLGMIASLGASSGYLAVMVLALYIHDQATTMLYSQPQIIWLACPLLLFWITRIWMLTHRGHMHDDPVVFAFRDRISLTVGALFCLVFWAAA